jgi:hypothetical protein
MSIHRRSFLLGLASAFGAASIPDLHARILNKGAPILLEPEHISDRIHVYDNGMLCLGDHWEKTFPRVTWLRYFTDLGARTKADIAEYAAIYDIDPGDLIGDEYWPEVYDLQYTPQAAAYHLLRRLKVGTGLRSKAQTCGRLDFFSGSNHPGSNDQWVEAGCDLSVSLLQAHLIELRQPIQVVMEVSHVVKDDWFDPDSMPADE